MGKPMSMAGPMRVWILAAIIGCGAWAVSAVADRPARMNRAGATTRPGAADNSASQAAASAGADAHQPRRARSLSDLPAKGSLLDIRAARRHGARDFSDIAGASGATAGVLCTQPAANCQAGDTFDALSSDQEFFVIADDFRPTTTGTITSVCWRGGYGKPGAGGFVDCQGVDLDNFTIRYYTNVGGAPGTLIGSFTQTQCPGTSCLTVTGPQATGAQIADQISEFEFTATHAAVAVTAGTCYWIEISNCLSADCTPLGDCAWFWEVGQPGNGWAMQHGDGNVPQSGPYTVSDVVGNDFAFCLNRALGDPLSCAPAGPANNNCPGTPISGTGTFLFDNTLSRTDPNRVPDCYPSVDTRIDGDVWYCWTSPCTDTVLVSTCNQADEDTMIAVYSGCTCPPNNNLLLQCNDDRCGVTSDLPIQSMTVFNAIAGQQYLIRLGTFPESPRGAGAFTIACGPPANAGCPGTVDCCDGTTEPNMPGCTDEACCELVCACDPFCCESTWDTDCATRGFQGSGCGAALLCPELCRVCGNPENGSCCEPAPVPPEGEPSRRGCSDAACCEAVCECDAFCCDSEWDEACANFGVNNGGCGARALCGELCAGGACPSGTVQFLNPATGVLDARQPHSEIDANDRMGLRVFRVQAPVGADNPGCWTLCESSAAGSANGIQSVVDNGDGSVTVTLLRPITPGAVTTITYTDDTTTRTTGRFTFHPGNVNADSFANINDVVALVTILRGTATPPYGLLSADLDFSTVITSEDLLRLGDLLNGGGAFNPWLSTPLPTGCP